MHREEGLPVSHNLSCIATSIAKTVNQEWGRGGRGFVARIGREGIRARI